MIYNQVGHMREKQWISYEDICKSGIQIYVYDYDFNFNFNFKVIIKSNHDWP